jgi:hypothetical protein
VESTLAIGASSRAPPPATAVARTLAVTSMRAACNRAASRLSSARVEKPPDSVAASGSLRITARMSSSILSTVAAVFAMLTRSWASDSLMTFQPPLTSPTRTPLCWTQPSAALGRRRRERSYFSDELVAFEVG